MKIVTGRFAVSVLVSAWVLGVAGAAYAQSGGSSGAAGMSGAPSGGANNAGLPGLGLTPGGGPNASPSPMPGLGTAPAVPAMGATGGATGGAGSNVSTARANGTSVYANPDPRAPGLAGRVAPPSH
ncbi:hypothetical protein [Paraburkholderia bryophila]|uniref:Uncharacterized protein n=1 Tax=Paraburkholderia bryophila TaxID=420952 RepID=A0A329B993_9BURK|nr:hypothetical protein [Paraburkholderia bryophila]RAS19366.1 hypothetical protein BX591_14330 [Paraburkholderia bryophila]